MVTGQLNGRKVQERFRRDAKSITKGCERHKAYSNAQGEEAGHKVMKTAARRQTSAWRMVNSRYAMDGANGAEEAGEASSGGLVVTVVKLQGALWYLVRMVPLMSDRLCNAGASRVSHPSSHPHL